MFMVHARCAVADGFAQACNKVAHHIRALRRFTKPEGHRRRRAMRILHQHAPLFFDREDAPACVAQLDHVTRPAVHGVVLVQRGNLHTFGLQHDGVDRCVRDRPAVANSRYARTAPGVQHTRNAIAQQVGPIAAPAVFNAGVKQRDQLIELRTA